MSVSHTINTPYSPKQRVLLGLAIGDALGAATEFATAERAERHPDLAFGYQPGSPFGFAPGEATDDTQMTIAGIRATAAHFAATPGAGLDTAEKQRAYAQACHAAFTAWAKSHPPDIGSQTRRACATTLSGIAAEYKERITGGFAPASGNGGLMRAAAPWLCGLHDEELLIATALHTAATHYDPQCIADSIALALLLEQADSARNFVYGVKATRTILKTYRVAGFIAPALRAAFGISEEDAAHFERDLTDALERSSEAMLKGTLDYYADPSGYTLHTLQNAVAHTAYTDDMSDPYGAAILEAARRGGDADTIGCVTGALAAAYDQYALTRPAHKNLLTNLRVGHSWAAWPDRKAPATPRLLALLGTGEAENAEEMKEAL